MKKFIFKTCFAACAALLAIAPLPTLAAAQSSLKPMKERIYETLQKKDITEIPEVEFLKNAPQAFAEPIDTGCCACIAITPEDFGPEGDQIFFITTPGKYTLQQDVTVFPSNPFSAAIIIVSDNVTLDLCSHTLAQGNAFPINYGIIIGEGLFPSDPEQMYKNIEIRNGNIINFTSAGITAYNASFDDPSLTPGAFQDLRFSNLNILDCGSFGNFDLSSGIQLASGVNFTDLNGLVGPTYAFENILIEDCNINRCLGDGSVCVVSGNDIVVRNTNANDLTNAESIFQTYAYFFYCKNLLMTNCQGNRARQIDSSSGQCGGLLTAACVNTYVKDCQFNDAFGEASSIVNSNPSDSKNAVFENCQFNNATGGSSAGIVAGVHMSDLDFQTTNADGMKFINCQFNGARVAGDNPNLNSRLCGVTAITLRNMIFENCQACNISSDTGRSVFGLRVSVDAESPAFPFANTYNITFKDCIASDISGIGIAGGIVTSAANLNQTPRQSNQANLVFDNCIAERIYSQTDTNRVVGIGELLNANGLTQFASTKNVFIRNCRVSDVHSNTGGTPSPVSAGIFVESAQNPVLVSNSVTDCDIGILFSGTNDITPNCFQLAATKEDALAAVPIPIDLTAELLVYTNVPGVGPFNAEFTANGPRLTGPITANIEPADPQFGCTPLVNDLTGKIGVVLGLTSQCTSSVFVPNVEAAGAIATIIVDLNDGARYGGSPNQTKPAVVISEADGLALQAAFLLNPNLLVTIDAVPSSSFIQKFKNKKRGNSVSFHNSDQVDSQHDFICPGADVNLTSLHWQSGDKIHYTTTGDPIPNLVNGQNYYLIVYIPGFTEHGLVQNNSVTNCILSGFQDNRKPTTSAWINNIGLLNGTKPSHRRNFKISWPNKKSQVDKGTLGEYPKRPNKNFNTSLINASTHSHSS